MNNDDTPLTNSASFGWMYCEDGGKYVDDFFAQKLERENNRLRAALNDIACGAACLNGYGIEEASRTAREAIQEDDAGVVQHRRVHPEECPPRRHDYWYAGQPDCPPELKAGGELHTLKCKACGKENPRDQSCSGVKETKK